MRSKIWRQFQGEKKFNGDNALEFWKATFEVLT